MTIGSEDVKTAWPLRFLQTIAFIFLGLVAVGSPQKYRQDMDPANETGRVHAAMAIVDHGSLHLDTVWDDVYPGWRSSRTLPNGDAAVKDGHFLLDKPPGVTLLTVPVIAALRKAKVDLELAPLLWLLTLLLAALPSVLFVVVFRRWLRSNLGKDALALLVAPAIVLATPWLLFGSQLVANTFAATLAGVGVFLALGRLEAGGSDESYPRGGFLGGLALGGAVLMESSAGLIALGTVGALLIDPSRRRRVPWLIFGGAGPALTFMVWNTLSFSNPFVTGYAFKAIPSMAAAHERGVFGLSWPQPDALFGLFLSAKRGLFFLSPWLILAPVGAVWCVLDRKISRAWRAIVILGTLIVPLLLSGFSDWHGGQSLGPRYLLFVLPLYGVAAALAVHRLEQSAIGKRVLPVFAGLLLSSLVLLVIANAGIPSVGEEITNPMFEIVLPVLWNAGPLGSVWSPLGGVITGAAITISAAITVMLLAAIRLRRARLSRGGSSSSWAAVLLIVGAAAVHLVLVALPRTEEPPNGAILLHARWIAYTYMGEKERCAEIRAEILRVEGPPGRRR